MNTIEHILKDGTIITAFERDHIGSMISKTGYYYEGGMLDFIKAEIPKGLMIDCGANIGNHTLYLAKYCATNVIAFEPFAETFEVLVKNIFQNKINNVLPYNLGLSNESKEVCMLLESESNVGMAKIVNEGELNASVICFDERYPILTEPLTLIKIDCEGYEEKVLKGMIKTITQHKPALFIECQTLVEYNTITATLVPMGYMPIKKFNSTPTYYFKHISINP